MQGPIEVMVLSFIVTIILLSTCVVPSTMAEPSDLLLVADDNFDGNVRLTWVIDDPIPVDRYEIYWSEKEFDSVAGMESRSTERGTIFMVLGLETKVRYYFAVTAIDGNGTILAEAYDSATPTVYEEPPLKEVNYWALMTATTIVLALFIMGVFAIPKMRGRKGEKLSEVPVGMECDGLTPDECKTYQRTVRRYMALDYTLKAGIVALALGALFLGEGVWLFGGLFALAFTFVPSLLKRNYQISIPWLLELLIFLALFLHVAGGVLGLYSRFENWDTMTHFVSAFMLGVVALTIIYLMHVYWDGLMMDVRAIMVLTVIAGAFLGVVWEVMEWSTDEVLGTMEQHGLDDTMKDLVMDMVGAMIAALLGAKWIMDGTMRRMTADFGDSLNERIFEQLAPELPRTMKGKAT